VFTRREFLATSASAIPSIALARRWRLAAVLRVGTITDPARAELERGLAFGAAEARRSASLFRWTVDRIEMSTGEARQASSVHAIIMGTVGATPNDSVPVLRLVCEAAPREDASFTIAPCEAGRTEEAWQPTLERYGAAQLNDRYRSATGNPMSGDAWLGWFAFKVITDSALKLGTVDPVQLRAYLERPTTHFDGHKGAPLKFDAERRLVQPLYATDAARSGA
jgi:hypothetical protein